MLLSLDSNDDPNGPRLLALSATRQVRLPPWPVAPKQLGTESHVEVWQYYTKVATSASWNINTFATVVTQTVDTLVSLPTLFHLRS